VLLFVDSLHTVFNMKTNGKTHNQVIKGVRLPTDLIKKIKRVAEEDGSTFSQFIRTAAIKALRTKQRTT
jgi:metal-responsive CopG/Arc/MetJ family transcriptional regulator